jgi:putative salt-induced outer membrane protein
MNLKIALLTVLYTFYTAALYAKEDKVSDLIAADSKTWQFYSPYADKENMHKWKLNNKTALGLVHLSGNTTSLTITGNESLTISKDVFVNTTDGGILYNRSGTAGGAITTINKNIFLRDQLEWHFHPKVYSFVGAGWESDVPQGVNHKVHGKLGLGGFLIETKHTVLRLEAGYQLSKEYLVAPSADQTLHSLVALTKFLWKINSWVYLKAEAENLFNLKKGSDYRVRISPSLNFHIWKYLSFSTGFEWKYDNQPPTGFEKSDFKTLLNIVFQFS